MHIRKTDSWVPATWSFHVHVSPWPCRYNRHGHLCAPIRFQEVITTLGSTDPRVAMRPGHAGTGSWETEGCFRYHSYPMLHCYTSFSEFTPGNKCKWCNKTRRCGKTKSTKQVNLAQRKCRIPLSSFIVLCICLPF